MSNEVHPTVGDFDGGGIANDVAYGYAGRLVFIIGNESALSKQGVWDGDRISYYGNDHIREMAGLS